MGFTIYIIGKVTVIKCSLTVQNDRSEIYKMLIFEPQMEEYTLYGRPSQFCTQLEQLRKENVKKFYQLSCKAKWEIFATAHLVLRSARFRVHHKKTFDVIFTFFFLSRQALQVPIILGDPGQLVG